MSKKKEKADTKSAGTEPAKGGGKTAAQKRKPAQAAAPEEKGTAKEVKQKKTAKESKAKSEAENRDLIIRGFVARLETLLEDFNLEMEIESNLTGQQRKRLTSARVRNNGFIDKAFDVAKDNPTFLPPNFDSYLLNWKMGNFQDLRQLMAVVEQLQRSVTDCFIIQADDCFRDALRIYGSLREQTRARVPGAAALFDLLSIYFTARRRIRQDGDAEPTEKQLERDVKRLIKGKADGEIIIKNETPHTSGGVHEVIDSVHTGRTAIKGTVEESIDEGTERKK